MRCSFSLCALVLLLSGCGAPPSLQPKSARPAKPEEPAAYNRLIFAGDVMFSRAVRRAILESQDPALPFHKIAPLMAGADIAFINLETPFSDTGTYQKGGLVFHAAPEMIAGLQLAHVAIASTANNHSRDCGAHGVDFTLSWLRSHDISPVGSAESETQAHAGVVLARHRVRFGFLGYTFDQQNGNWHDIDRRICTLDIASMKADVASLLKRADVVIVSMHAGVEYMPKPSVKQVEFAHAAIDAGATLVVGHHPHVVEPLEIYKGKQIYYSLGNFVFDQYQREQTQHGEMVAVSFLGPTVLSSRILPVRITPTGPELE